MSAEYVRRPGKPVFRHGRYIEVDELVPVSPPPQRQPFEARFVQIPKGWVKALSRAKNWPAYALALALLAERHKRKHVGGEVVISAATVPGMSRTTRWRAAGILVRLGLIEVEKASHFTALRVLVFHK